MKKRRMTKSEYRHRLSSEEQRRRLYKEKLAKTSPVKISYLPGFEPPPPPEPPKSKTKFPFQAWINGRPVMIHALHQPAEYLDDVWYGDPEDRDDAWLHHGLGIGDDA